MDDCAQRTVLGLLLERHTAMLSVEEVHGQVSDVPDLGDAADRLVRDGLANRVGHLIGASRAAVRADQFISA
jgi:hypothetical protein